MITAAIDVIGCVWAIQYIVPAIFDQQTGAWVNLGIIVLAVLHIVKRLLY